MTIERERNCFGLFNRRRKLGEGANRAIFGGFGQDEMTTYFVDVVSPDVIRVMTARVLHPAKGQRPVLDRVQLFEKEEINETFIGRQRKFGIRDRIVWKKC